jgi:hypothetical protein
MSKRHKPSARTRLADYQLIDRGRGSFETVTPLGSSRFDFQNRGPMRPGKTEQDFMKPSDRPRVIAATARVNYPNHLRGDRAPATAERRAA